MPTDDDDVDGKQADQNGQVKSAETMPFTPEEITTVRAKAQEILESLEHQPPDPRSWINDGFKVPSPDTRSERCQYFDTHGFLKIEQFTGMH